MMKKVTLHEMDGVRIIALDNEAFDWGIEEEDFKAAQVISKNDPAMKDNFLGSVQRHFVDCFSEFLGRPTSLEEINRAIADGWIES